MLKILIWFWWNSLLRVQSWVRTGHRRVFSWLCGLQVFLLFFEASILSWASAPNRSSKLLTFDSRAAENTQTSNIKDILWSWKMHYCRFFTGSWISDPDPGSRISDTGSRIPDLGSLIPDPRSRISDPGSRILNLYFWELSDNFLDKQFYNSLKSSLISSGVSRRDRNS